MTMRRACVGFSLLEILVAFVILALALGVLMRVFSGALYNTSVSERLATATLIAESKLAAVGVEMPLEEQETEGDEAGGYRWRIKILRDEADTGSMDATPSLELYRVEAYVSWPEAGSKTRNIHLTTLRVGAVE